MRACERSQIPIGGGLGEKLLQVSLLAMAGQYGEIKSKRWLGQSAYAFFYHAIPDWLKKKKAKSSSSKYQRLAE